MEVITRSPHYKNQYVHRRDSMSLASLPAQEVDARERVGLVVRAEDDDDDDDEEEEEDDLEEYEDDQGYQDMET